MKKEAQVIMLPTENKTNIAIIGKNLRYSDCTFSNHENLLCQYGHLYFTSDEELKENEWFYSPELKRPQIFGHNNIPKNRGFKKIIATTDKSLELPQISQSFIKEYCKNPIDTVLVEFNTYPISPNGNVVGTNREYPYDGLISNFTIEYKLKVNPNNTINIFPIKDSWSREEVIKLIRRYSKECTEQPWFVSDEEWIETNL